MPNLWLVPCKSFKRRTENSVSAPGFFGGLKKLCEDLQLDEALQSVKQLDQHGNFVSTNILYCLLQGCINKKDLDSGRKVHSLIIKNKFQSSAFLGSQLIRMFASCGSLLEANKVFNKLPRPNVFAWGEIISAHAKLENGQQAINLYHQMQQCGLKPDGHIFVAVLQACASVADHTQGKLIHAHIIESGFESNFFVGTSLVDMYTHCANIMDAYRVFKRLQNRNVVMWNAMIAGYAQHGYPQKSNTLFQQMQKEGMKPNKRTWNVIISGSAQNGHAEEALQLLHQMQEKGMEPNVVTWNAIIAGYTQHDHGQEALQVFQQMQLEGMEPNQVTFLSILKACSSVAALDHGKVIHAHIIESSGELDNIVGNTMIKMYARCGSLENACEVFDRLPERGVVTWNALIAGYAQHNKHRLALYCFEDMQQEGLKPDVVTFTSLLSACGHLGLVNEGCHHFKLMREDHGIVPVHEHYNCMIDLLGRAGCLTEAKDLLQTVPFHHNSEGWRSLLSHCGTHGEVELGKWCFENVVSMDVRDSAAYVLMSNIYARAGMWEDAHHVEELRICANAEKKPGKAFIEVHNKVHDFVVGDRSHPRSDNIHAKLMNLYERMKDGGYMAHLDSLPQLSSNELKEDTLWGHCEKLAIAFGLISLPEGATIRVVKNLRICADCHDATKIISKIERRNIIVTDAYRVHCFADGLCSCEDFF